MSDKTVVGFVIIISILVFVAFCGILSTNHITYKEAKDNIQWCYDQKGKATFNRYNEYTGCEVQK